MVPECCAKVSALSGGGRHGGWWVASEEVLSRLIYRLRKLDLERFLPPS